MSFLGVRLGRFLPDALLGQDTATETYKAREGTGSPEEDGQVFVLKVLKKEVQAADAGIRQTFFEWAQSYSGTILPGIATVAEIGEDSETSFTATPFTEGADLKALRNEASQGGVTPDPQLGLHLARRIVERLSSLHNQPGGSRPHGGLSPGNVLVAPNGEIWLLDAGLGDTLLTRHGLWPSHWQFLAPEQLRGLPATPSSDFYALGALLYFFFFGEPPFVAHQPDELSGRIERGGYPTEGLPPAVLEVLVRLLAPAAEARPRSVGEALRRISVALLSMRASVPSATVATNAVPAPAASIPTTPAESVAVLAEEAPSAMVDEANQGAQKDGKRWASDEQASAIDAFQTGRTGLATELSGDDPEVGVVYDEDDEEEVEEIGPDGKVHRRRRPRSFRLLAWTHSAFARKIFRYAWMPAVVLLIAAAIQGYLWHRTFRAVRAESDRQKMVAAQAEAAQEARRPKLPEKTVFPPGQLQVTISPQGALVWVDGVEMGTAPLTLTTQPGVHRLVVTAQGYRMLRDVVNTTQGAAFVREMAPATFPMEGSVSLNIACTTAGKYPVFVDGRDIGVVCPIAGIRLEPGKHMAGIFVIPQDRMWTIEREILPERPQRVYFKY